MSIQAFMFIEYLPKQKFWVSTLQDKQDVILLSQYWRRIGCGRGRGGWFHVHHEISWIEDCKREEEDKEKRLGQELST